MHYRSLVGSIGHLLRRTSPLFLSGILWLGESASLSFGEDWKEFRGPSQNGTVNGRSLPTHWSETENVRWYSEVPGLGWSSPILFADKIYLTTAIRPDTDSKAELAGPQRLMLVCLDAKNGKRLWEKTIFEQPDDAPAIHKKNSHASPTHEDRIYLHFGHQGTACVDLDGKLIWQNRDHVYPPTHGNGGSPIVVNDMLVVTCDGGEPSYTLALDLKTGKERWKTNRGVKTDRPFSFCTPQLIEVNGKSQIVSPGSDIVQSLSPKDGSVIWSVKYDGFSVVPRPVFYRGVVYISTGYMTPKILAIDPTGTGDVTKSHLLWSYKGGAPNTPSFVPFQDQLLMVSDAGIAASVNVKTGQENWKKRIGGNYSSSLLLVDDKLYLQSETGESTVYEVGEDWTIIAKNSLPGRIFASYAVCESDWIIRTEKGVYRIGRP